MTTLTPASNLVAKVRNQSPMVARRKLLRSIMKRANTIAKNAYNVHNTSVERIAAFGAATTAKEFLSLSLSLAWAEHRANKELYTIQGKIPRKSMQTIHAALSAKITQTNSDLSLTQAERFYEQARTMILSRNAGKFEESEMTLAYNVAFNIATDENYSLVA